MRIKTRLRITTGIALGVALFMALSLIWSFSEVSRAERSRDTASEMRRLAYERTVLRDDYLLRKEDRARKQWIAKTEDLRKLMKSAEGRFQNSDEQAMMKEAREDFEVTRSAFTQVIENRDPHQGRAEKAFLPDEAEKITLGQVFMKAYALENDLRRLSELAEQKASTARSRAVFIIVLTVLGGIIVIVTNSVLLNRSLSKGLAELGRGVAILGAGDLDHRIDIRGDDELSDLARTSNEMAAKLKESYTSVGNLQREIERRKRTEEELQETSDYLDNLFGYANAPIVVWDPLLRITRFNRAFETLAGKKAEDVIGHSPEFLFPRDQVQTSMELVRKTMSGARWEAVEINIVHSDGSNHVVLWNSATLFARDGITPVATIAQGQDITERKKAEETLRDSEERLHMLIEGVKDYAIYLLDVNGNVVSWNAGAERLKSYQGSEIIGRDYALFFTPEDRESGKPGRLLDEAKFKGHIEDEGWRVRKDGSRFWADAVITVLRDPAGHPRGFAKITRDITEHMRVAKALQESETRLREAQKMAQLGYWNWNVSTGIVEWSEEIYKIFHLDPNKFTPHIDSILALSPWPEDHQRDKELIRKAMESHEKGAYEQRFLRPDGSTGYYNSTFQGKYDERGKLVSIVGTVLDITERKKAEEEIGKLNEELEQRVRDRTAQLEVANRELEGFSYSVSHDLRAPLRHLTGFVEMLAKRATTLDDKSRHYLEVITTAASQMGRLIDDLLSFSRMGRTEMMRTRVDLKSLLDEAIRDLHTEVKGRNIHWDVKDLPEVSGDPAMLKLVLVNILLNAIKFTRPREQALIEVGSEQTDGEVIVSVRDNGVGFDPKYTDKLFNLFQRLHRAEEFEGTGVGLANVRRIIHRHGGRTWAEGALNAGAVIRFSLPNKKGESI